MHDDLRQACQDALHGAFADQIRKLYAALCVELGNADTDVAEDDAVQRAVKGMRLAAHALRRSLQASDGAVHQG
jgi:hypothetical protein